MSQTHCECCNHPMNMNDQSLQWARGSGIKRLSVHFLFQCGFYNLIMASDLFSTHIAFVSSKSDLELAKTHILDWILYILDAILPEVACILTASFDLGSFHTLTELKSSVFTLLVWFVWAGVKPAITLVSDQINWTRTLLRRQSLLVNKRFVWSVKWPRFNPATGSSMCFGPEQLL